MHVKDDALIEAARAVLEKNSRGSWTPPTSVTLYPHQWLWDSFFIAIGQRHYSILRAQDEIRSAFRAQWKNGMVPHIMFSEESDYHAGPALWKSSKSSLSAPESIETTGVTQPPVVAEATIQIGALLNETERKEWYREMYPRILDWHQMLYRERDPREDGLVRILLPWESGMDNSPPLMEMLHKYAQSNKVRLMKATGLDQWVELLRRDTKEVPAEERISTLDLHAIYDLVKSMRSKHYDYHKMLPGHKFQVTDLAYNCILIRANYHLKTIAETIGAELPADIKHAMRVAPLSLETLWDERTQYYYSRDAISGRLIKMPGVAALLPLYAVQLPPERVQILLHHLHDPQKFASKYPIPSAPLDSKYFNAHRYWQGPTWININWLIIKGLERQNEQHEADTLRKKTIALVKHTAPHEGFYEYYSPLDGSVAGAPDFSWTAALIIDLLKTRSASH